MCVRVFWFSVLLFLDLCLFYCVVMCWLWVSAVSFLLYACDVCVVPCVCFIACFVCSFVCKFCFTSVCSDVFVFCVLAVCVVAVGLRCVIRLVCLFSVLLTLVGVYCAVVWLLFLL